MPESSRRRPTLLAISEGVAPTGYARVMHALLGRLATSLSVVHFAVNYRGHARSLQWKLVPNRVRGDPYGRLQLPELLARHRPDVVLVLHDIPVWEVYRRAIATHAPRARTIVYCPVHEPPFAHEDLRALLSADAVVLFTEYGRRVVAETLRHLAGDAVPHMDVIPHGLDHERFRALDGPGEVASERRRRLRERLLPHRPDLHDAFIVLNANRNTRRKRIDRTLRIVAEAAHRLAGSVPIALWLHHATDDPGIDVSALARQLGIADRLVLSRPSTEHSVESDDLLNLVYNACDAGINTSDHEGWGLVTFEHAATGAPQLVPGVGATAELWRDSGLLLREEGEAEAASMLVDLASDRATYERWARAARACALRADRAWDAVAERWMTLIRALLDDAQDLSSDSDIRTQERALLC